LESVYPEIRIHWLGKQVTSDLSGALSSSLENPLESFIALAVVHITASGLQGEQPLVNRTM
jgi:hypothetical protein